MFATDNEQMWIIKVALFLKTFIFLNFFLEGGGGRAGGGEEQFVINFGIVFRDLW